MAEEGSTRMNSRLSPLHRPALLLGLAVLIWHAFGRLDAGPAVPEFVPPGRHRVTVSIVDETTGGSLPARISFTDAAGVYYPPLGRPWAMPSRPTGGNLLLPDGSRYAYVDGPFQIDLPPGTVNVEAVHGFEYEVHRSAFDPSKTEAGSLTVPLKRWIDMESRGWYPGDTHVHFPNPAAAKLEMKGEGLRVTNLLALKSGVGNGKRNGDGTFWNVEHFLGKLSPLSDERHLIYTNEEFRNHFLGHLIFLNLKKLVWPISTGELPENGWGGYAVPTHADAAESARSQGGVVIWAHFPYPNGECPVDVALGKIDAFDILTTGDPFELHPTLRRIYKMYGPKVYDMAPIDVYYAYLNCGFRVSASSGSDKMSPAVPMGSARVYVKTGSKVDYPSWVEGIRKGNTFISTAPLIEIDVDGRGPGRRYPRLEGLDRQRRPRSDGPRQIPVTDALRTFGDHPQRESRGVRQTEGPAALRGTHSNGQTGSQRLGSGPLLRTGNAGLRRASRALVRMPVFAHTNPVYVSLEDRPADPGEAPALFLDQIDYLKEYVQHRGIYPSAEVKQRVLDQIEEAAGIYRSLGSP